MAQVGALSITRVAWREFYRTPTNPGGSFLKLPRARFCVGAIYTNYRYQLGLSQKLPMHSSNMTLQFLQVVASNQQLSQV